MPNTTDFYIGGQWVAPHAQNDLDVINPATEEVCATISLGGQADVDAAVPPRALPSTAIRKPRKRSVWRSCAGFSTSTRPGPRIWPRPSAWRWARPSTCRATRRPPPGRAISNFITRIGRLRLRTPAWRPCPERPDHLRGGRRHRHDHPVELADEPGHAEGDPGACHGLHDDPETLGDRAAVGADLRRDPRRGRGARGRLQPCQRRRTRRRHHAVGPSRISTRSASPARPAPASPSRRTPPIR